MREIIEKCRKEVKRLKEMKNKPDNIDQLVETLDNVINRLEDNPLDNEAVRIIKDYFRGEMNVD